MRKRLVPLLIIVVGVIGFILLKATRSEPEPVTPQERTWRVETMVVDPEARQPSLTLYGQLESPRRFTVVAPMAGRIDQLPARDGQTVAQGELLVALDDRDIEPMIRQAQADLADALAQLDREQIEHASDRKALALEQRILDNARRGLGRVEQLVERKLVSRTELESAEDLSERAALTVAVRQRSIQSHEARKAALQARVERAQSTLDAVQRDATRSRYTAPFAGVVADVQVAPGDQVNANQALLDFYPIEGLELRATLPQIHAMDFTRALAAGEQLVAQTLETDSELTMTLQRIAGQADATGVEALFVLDQPAPGLRLGNLLAISVPKPAAPESVAVPYSALYGNNTVYALEEGRMSHIEVERIGETLMDNGERWLLVRATELAPGTRIITTHLPNAMQGLKVDTLPDSATESAQ
ncbi:HlyD family efflux transporter periplasmic adaptor subunit [uncultured Halopseudomonas sp.]|mgnify:CR=1 FL=1|uniref:efflux RND transporter periplasmic adaptor subunit n=1 Tax=uncultured Halopseudomonas sp. TaxID=2901193 RepID=UPI0030EE1607|tara:strand:- start:11952 stop:13199 length:1248 start_codon:yes stop_codon:yes gene_type:complete